MWAEKVAGVATVALLAGCSPTAPDLQTDDTSSSYDEVVIEPAEIPPKPEPEPAPEWQQSASPSDVEVCKIPDPRPRSEQLLYRGMRSGDLIGRDPVGFTEWRRDGLLPIEDEANIIIAKIAWEDAPPSASIPDGTVAEQAQKMTELGHFWSQDTFTYNFQVVDGWVEIPVAHADYPISSGDDVDHSPDAYALMEDNIETVSQLVVENLPADLDFEAADIVVPIWSHNVTEFTMPVTWRGGGLRSPNGEVTDVLFMGNSTFMHQYLTNTWSWLAHDFLHLQGLNEHAPGPLFGTHIGGYMIPGPYGYSTVISAWETFLLGWFDDSQIHCIVADQIADVEQVILTPMEHYGGERKTIVIPTTDYKALVVESRRPEGYSLTWPQGNRGLLVYEIDTDRHHLDHGENQCANSRENNPKWGYYILPDGASEAQDCNDPAPYFVKPGMTLTDSGVTIELIHSADDADYIEISSAD